MSEKLIQKTKVSEVEIMKVNEELRTASGWAWTSETRADFDSPWEIYIDLQNDYIPEDVSEKAAKGYAEGDRVAKDMHQGEPIGQVIHTFPLTKANAEAMGIQSTKSGVMVTMRIDDDDVWEQVKSGERRAFSLGGAASYERVEDDE